MFRSSSRPVRQEINEPLLGETVFSVEDDSDSETSTSDHARPTANEPGRVRFQDNVQIIEPPSEPSEPSWNYPPRLKSTVSSRETEYELDSDDLEDSVEPDSLPQRRSPGYVDQSMPLLVGLYDASSSRTRHDTPSRSSFGDTPDGVDLEMLRTKSSAGGGMLDSIANMANSILGAGIIGLPYAMAQAGFVFGIILLVVLCGVTDWTIRLIVVNAKLSGRTSYIEIMGHCFGSSGRAAVSIFQFAFAFGGMCAFQIIIGDTIPAVIRSIFPNLASSPFPLHLFASRTFIIIFCTTCISYPLSLYRDIHKLARASGLALIGMVIIVVSVFIEGPHVSDDLKGDPEYRWSIFGPGIFQAIGVISFAFVCHHNSLLIYGSLKTPTLDRFAKVTHISTLLSLIASTALATSGYMVFTNKTRGNVLNNFSSTNTLINVARLCFGMNMFTTLPLELFVCREVIEQYFFSHEAFSMQRHLFFTTTILVSSMFIGLITCDLGVMLEITGGASATALAFIFPAACYLKLISAQSKPQEWKWFTRQALPAVICVFFGVAVLIISLVLALAKSWTSEGKTKICT